MPSTGLPSITLPLGKLKGETKYRILAVKPVTRRGGSWQITVPKEVVSSFNPKEDRLVFVELEIEKVKYYLLLKAGATAIL